DPISHGRRHAGRPARVRAGRRGSLRLRAPDAPRANGTRVHAAGRGHDQARALPGRSRAARSRLPLPRVPAALARVPQKPLRPEGFFGADAAVAAQRLLLSGLDADDPGGDCGRDAVGARGAARGGSRLSIEARPGPVIAFAAMKKTAAALAALLAA